MSFIVLKQERVLSLAEAIVLFDRLANERFISHGYGIDGCFARAHISSDMAGGSLKKIWSFPARVYDEDGHVLRNNDIRMGDKFRLNPASFGDQILWNFHVANVAPVRFPDGVKDVVFDPAIFDGPVLVRDWLKIMGADQSKYFTTENNVTLDVKEYGVSIEKVGGEAEYQDLLSTYASVIDPEGAKRLVVPVTPFGAVPKLSEYIMDGHNRFDFRYVSCHLRPVEMADRADYEAMMGHFNKAHEFCVQSGTAQAVRVVYPSALRQGGEARGHGWVSEGLLQAGAVPNCALD